jgi:sugar lactone lactonase YvrE
MSAEEPKGRRGAVPGEVASMVNHTLAGAEPVPVGVPAAALGEGPHWDTASGSLYWVDAPAGLVHRLDLAGDHESWDAGQPVNAVVPRAAGGLVLTARDGFLVMDTATGEVAPLADVEAANPATKMNDGACDRAGRFFAGTMAADESPGQGGLYRLDPDLELTQLRTGVGLSNGIGWSPDETRMYYVDSLAYQVEAIDYDPATGETGRSRVIAPLGQGEVMPDGLTVDANGHIWVAIWGGGAVQRYRPDGRLMEIVKVPAVNVTSCAFGGQDLDVLYITTAAGPGLAAGPLFSCRPGPAGQPSHPFRG